MIRNVEKEKIVNESSVLVEEIKSIITKIRNLVASSVKKIFVRDLKKAVKLDLSGNTSYNNSQVNYCKEEKRRIAKVHSLII
ncbi:MAG: hypothetical protein ACXAEU_08280 [Candidatus Hodarchaeales archaeon]|jgi:hypothetical protein